VLSLQESKGLSVDSIAQAINSVRAELVEAHVIRQLVETFEHAKTFGSLIQIPYALKTHLVVLPQVLALVKQSGELYASAAADDLLPLVQQAQVLAMQFDAVVANPPYMGNKFLAPILKAYLKDKYDGFEKDLFSSFIVRNLTLTKDSGNLGFMSPFVWMFISSYEELRQKLLYNATLTSLVQLEYSGFDGAVVPICTFTLHKAHISNFTGSFVRLSEFRGADQQGPRTLEAIQNKNCGWFYSSKPDEFKKIPGSPIAYWLSESTLHGYETMDFLLGTLVKSEGKMVTSDNARFVRKIWEIDAGEIRKERNGKWFKFAMGGDFRKWSGNIEDAIDWSKSALNFYRTHNSARLIRSEFWDQEGLTWGKISSSHPSFRFLDEDEIYQETAIISNDREIIIPMLGLLNSVIGRHYLTFLSPTLNFQLEDIKSIPTKNWSFIKSTVQKNVLKAIEISKIDWDGRETSAGFMSNLLCVNRTDLPSSFSEHKRRIDSSIATMKLIEEENNRIFINAYGLQSELSPEVPESQITLARADREKDSQRLISYAIGCMMGRYSLDEPGLIYAHAGNVGFEPGRYATFPADADGIVPITDELWFADDACSRIREFLRAVWGPDTLEENMTWLAESLGTKVSETPDETIRRYIADKFFKDHLQTYKKRPIYWLFSSGRQGAFQALVYLHRYNESTLARMRAEYVIPLTAKMASRLEMLEQDANAASSAAARTKIRKQIETLRKKQTELLAFDENLRHFADMRITLDLDDGVKVNYGKFGDLLEGVKIVTGGGADD
jgi:hypothetical protein